MEPKRRGPESASRRHPGRDAVRRLSPRAGVRTQCLLAALLWTIAATILGARGVSWLVGSPLALPLFATALVLGTAKARYLLDAVVSSALERIRERGRDACAGGFLSARSWLVVAVMVAGGHALRLTSIPRPWLGALYCTIGTALLIASRRYWQVVSGTTPA